MVPVGFVIWDCLILWSVNGMAFIVSLLSVSPWAFQNVMTFSSPVRSAFKEAPNLSPGGVMGMKVSSNQMQIGFSSLNPSI